MKPLSRLLALGVVLALVVVTLVAQAPAPAAPAGPALTADEQAMLSLVISLRTVANEACQSLDAFKQYTDSTARVGQRIEANHPGYAMNWQTGALAAKTPPPKK